MRLVALAYWPKNVLRYKCWKLPAAYQHREQRTLYEREKYLALRGEVGRFFLDFAIYFHSIEF